MDPTLPPGLYIVATPIGNLSDLSPRASETRENVMLRLYYGSDASPGLYIVATPIGNLSDLSPRAAETLRRADLILAEDKRVTAKLLAHTGARAPMATYHDHSSEADRQRALEAIAGKAVALVSDAGTPLISDPGYKLVRAAREAGLPIFTIPGPCAAIAGLTVAGLPTDRFLFAGFLPARPKARRDAIAELAGIRASLVLYETGPRLGGALADLAAGLVIGPPPERQASEADLDAALIAALAELSPSRAAARVADLLDVPKKRAYARALELSR
jgi:16S rRNA (cytidine1402-2'-O)-methyltransferase